jgi:Rrf2 family cysteine metabolism transcriptional repressor
VRLSSRGRYSVRAMMELALHFGHGLLQVKDISASQQISERYLEQLFVRLRRAGLVKSTRGAGGGFMLARPPAEIRLSEVIRAVEGSVAPARCIDEPELCPHIGECVTRLVWGEMARAISQVLEARTLQDLVEQHREKEVGRRC